MPNPKTARARPVPIATNGWVRKCEVDDFLDRHLPVPTQIVSNEEFEPLPQTVEQRRVERLRPRDGGAALPPPRDRAGGSSCAAPAEWPRPSPP
jgi:hypothetical protein